MKEQLEKTKEEALRQIESSEALEGLNDIRISYLGKKGELTNLLKSTKGVVLEDRPKVGQMVSNIRGLIEGRLEEAKTALAGKAREEQLKREVIDVALPIRKNNVGHSRPNTIALEGVGRIFVGMGYGIVEGPGAEYDRYNSEKLSISEGYLTGDKQDTFYINGDILLRSQISSIQVRIMEKGRFLIRMIAPGHVFRSDEADATRLPSFHQIEGLVISRDIAFADLKGTPAEFARELFGPETEIKFHPHHFPFTEPSVEVDVTCFKCGGPGYRPYKNSGWTEILGCDMVHPYALEICGVDPDEYSGFAFGVELERIALLKYEIDDIHLLYENDIRFLKQL